MCRWREEACTLHTTPPLTVSASRAPTLQCKHFLHIFVGGTTGVLVWKL